MHLDTGARRAVQEEDYRVHAPLLHLQFPSDISVWLVITQYLHHVAMGNQKHSRHVGIR